MAEILNIALYRRGCPNCRWHGKDRCRKPGGWHWDTEYNRCIDFEWSEAAWERPLNVQKEREHGREEETHDPATEG